MNPVAAPGAAVDLLGLHRCDPRRYPFLLQSASQHAGTGRYDLLLAFPSRVLELRGRRCRLDGVLQPEGSDFLALLSQLQREGAREAPAELPFCGGWFVYLGYEAAVAIEPRLRLPHTPYALPDALAVRCPSAVVVDRLAQRSWLVAPDAEQLQALQRDLAGPASATVPLPPLAAVEEDEPARFLAGVERILDYLRAGDAFQVNLSRAWRARFARAPEPAALYRALCQANPAPFAGLMSWQGSSVLSSSPERLVAVADAAVQTRPIAGTCPRHADAAADALARERLVASAKERAEHIMLIDLERNDLGRVCAPGSVAVEELLTVESYTHVHHLVSGVGGRLRPQIGAGEVLRALFPGGTITGCPKVRAMEIIAELEGVGRGPYTGAFGYLSDCGRMDFNILIRSLVLEGDRLGLRAGAGIVADSDPAAELEETRHKARGLLRALGARQ